ncbi:hypothetical protein [Bacillus sp. JJ722]
MKKATERIIKVFPKLKDKITAYESVLLAEDAFCTLNHYKKEGV